MTTTPAIHLPVSVAVDLPLWRAKRAAQAILPHVSTDDITPILTTARVGGGYLLATDRYSVGRFTLQGTDVDQPVKNTDIRYGETEEHYQDRLEEWRNMHEVRYFQAGERTTDTQEMLVPLDAIRRVSTLSAALLPCGKVAEKTARVRIEAHEPQPHVKPEYITYKWVDVLLYEQDRAVFRQTFLGVIGALPPVGRLMDEWAPAEEPGTLNFTAWNLSKMTRFADRNDIIRVTAGKPGSSQPRLAPTRLEVGSDFTALLQPNLDLR